jgi:hypothetical protein
MNLAVLIPAVLTDVRARGGYATKTKLLKLLYLLDIDAFRKTRATLTDFKWIFYKYGPWAREYDGVLERLEQNGRIRFRTGDKPEMETVFIEATEPVALSAAFPAILEELQARRVIEVWADRPTGEILDYVYFHTAPMHEAQRGKALNFDTVLREEPPTEYKRTSSVLDAGERKKKQSAFRRAIKEVTENRSHAYYVEPRYDAEFWRAVETLDREPD